MPREYTYDVLGTFDFRLVKLWPGTWSDPVQIELDTYSLVAEVFPFYEAASYTWASASDTTPIRCDGSTLFVIKSAVLVLRRFRRNNCYRLIWIDAICIDQANTQERAQQVTRMDIIYRQASRVLIYLGEEDATSNIALDGIAKPDSSNSRTSSFEAITTLLKDRTWFSRVWVIQEVALADCALVICGQRCVPWVCFTAWWARNEYKLQGWLNPSPTLTLAPVAVKQRSLLQQLHETRRNQSTDPRDKVYALMGILAPEERRSVLVDYNIPVADLYLDVVTAILKLTKSLQFLSGVGYLDINWPLIATWIPDWSTNLQVTSLGLSNHFLEPFDAGGQPCSGCEIRQQGNSIPILSCLGIALDLLSICGAECPGGDRFSWYENINTILNEWNSLVLSRTRSARESRLTRLFGRSPKRTLLVGSKYVEFAAEDCLYPSLIAEPSPTLDITQESKYGTSARTPRQLTVEDVKFCFGRRFCMSDSGYYCLAPSNAKVGDTVAVLLGAPVPHVLRQQRDGFYTYVGECHVQGVMGGEALAHLSDQLRAIGHRCRPFRESKSRAPLQRFNIV